MYQTFEFPLPKLILGAVCPFYFYFGQFFLLICKFYKDYFNSSWASFICCDIIFQTIACFKNQLIYIYSVFIGEGNGNPLQYSYLENPRNRGTWWAAVYGAAQSWTQLKRLSSSSSIVYLYKQKLLNIMKNLSTFYILICVIVSQSENLILL